MAARQALSKIPLQAPQKFTDYTLSLIFDGFSLMFNAQTVVDNMSIILSIF